MKIAIVVPYIHEGGGVPMVARYLHDLLSHHECQLISVSTSKNDKYSVKLFYPRTWFKGIRLGHSTWDNRPVIDVGAFLTEFEFQRYMPNRKLTDLLNQFDIVQIVAGAPAIANIAKNVKVPVFLQVATLVKEERNKLIANSKGIKKIYHLLTTMVTSALEELALQRVDLIFVENLWLQRHLEMKVGAAKVVMAPPGVDTDIFKPLSQNDIQQQNPYIISVGRFNDQRKNVRLLFEAYFQLRKTNPCPPHLILAGLNGPTEDDWRFAEEIGIKAHVTFKQNVSEPDLVRLLQNAILFICSSDEEGLGIAMLEALACGIPVVTTRCGGPEIFVQDGVNGFLVDRGDSSALADKIEKLLVDNQLRQQMGKAAHQTVESQFSSHVTGKVFLNCYEKFSRKEDT